MQSELLKSTQVPHQVKTNTFINTHTIAIIIIGICAFINLYAIQPILPLLTEVFHASKLMISLTVTTSTAGVALAAPFVGRFANKLGLKKLIVTSTLLLGLATFLAASSKTLNQLIFWRFIQGIITPAIFVIAVTYINEEWRSKRAGSAMATYITGTVLGGFSGRILVALTESRLGWRGCFLMLGLINILGAIVIKVLLPTEQNYVKQENTTHYITILRDHLKNRPLVSIYFVGFCVLFSLLGIFNYLTFRLAAKPFNLSTASLGFIFFVYLFGAIFTPLSGKWIDRYGQRSTLSTAVIIAISGLLLTLTNNLVLIILGLAIFCTGIFIAQTTANSFIGKVVNSHQAMAVGLYVTCYYLGGSAGSLVLGWFWQLGGWWACVILVVLLQLFCMTIARKFWNITLR